MAEYSIYLTAEYIIDDVMEVADSGGSMGVILSFQIVIQWRKPPLEMKLIIVIPSW